MSKEDTKGKVVRDIDPPEQVSDNVRVRSLSDLDFDQEQRVKALVAAREIVTQRSGFGSASAGTSDILRVARYIITGQDPWDTAQKEEG